MNDDPDPPILPDDVDAIWMTDEHHEFDWQRLPEFTDDFSWVKPLTLPNVTPMSEKEIAALVNSTNQHWRRNR